MGLCRVEEANYTLQLFNYYIVIKLLIIAMLKEFNLPNNANQILPETCYSKQLDGTF